MIEKIIYINLDRRKDRRIKMEKMLSRINVPFERFAAISPSLEDIKPGGKHYKLVEKSKPKLRKQSKSLRGRVGCWLSHRTVLDQNKDSRSPFLILEDDVWFNQDTLDLFLSRVSILPKDWDVFRVCWKMFWKGEKDFIRANLKRQNIEKIEDYIFKVTKPRKILGGSHFVLCQNAGKLVDILDNNPLIEADIAYTTKGMNSYLTRLRALRELRMGSDIAGGGL